MNAKIFFYLSLLLLVLSGGYWLVNHPYFRIAHIDISSPNQGNLQHANQMQIFEAVRPALTGSFFTVNLQEAKRAALAQPWVKQVKIDRIAPATIKIEVSEYEVSARWVRDGWEAGLISPDAEVFQAAIDTKLPEMDGDFASLPEMLQQYATFESRLKPLRLSIKRLQYTPRSSWTIMLTNGVEIRLGRDNIHARLMRFADLWPRELAAQATYLDYVDMRYPNGAAVKRRRDAPDLIPMAD